MTRLDALSAGKGYDAPAVAFSHHKIKVGGELSAGQAVVYLADPQARSGDYYSEGGRSPMIWMASAASREKLGLGDQVELWKVERLLKGQHPITGELVRKYGPDGTLTGAIDYTFSPAPKSVSILWAMAPPALKVEIENMVVTSVGQAVSVLKQKADLVRERFAPGPRGVRNVKANDVIGMMVLHTTARLSESKPGVPDPQVHAHTLLFADRRENGKLRAIEDSQVLKHRSEMDAEASGALASMFGRMGFEIDRQLVKDNRGKVKSVRWELAGIPASLIEAMSARSQDMTDLARQYKAETGRNALGPRWERYASERRGRKSSKSRAELHALWEEEGRAHGFGPEEAQALADAAVARGEDWSRRDETSYEAQLLRKEILADVCRDNALVPEPQLDAFVQQRAIGLVDPMTARRITADLFGDGDLLATTSGMVTTLEVLAEEQRAERALNQLLEAEPSPPVDQAQLEARLQEAEDEHHPFDPEQAAAIALALSGARFVSISGPAGTGKGQTSKAMVDLWRSQGRRVFALAVAGRTTQQAAHDSGAEPLTLDGLTARTKPRWNQPAIEFPPPFQLRKSDVLLVDEAAMIDHHRYADLLQTTARAGATLVQIGDDEQLSAVGPGGLWTVFHGLAQDRELAIELRTVYRAHNPRESQAWTDIREGRIEEGFVWHRDVGQLHLYETRRELQQGLVDSWWSRGHEGAIVVDTSNAERDEINRMAQQRRLEAGELGAEVMTLARGQEIRVGDRVLTAEAPAYLNRDLNGPGRRIENGTEATVIGLRTGRFDYRDAQYEAERQATGAPNVALLRLHEPGGDRTVAVDPTIDLELAYARHIQKGQGMTVETTELAVSETTGQQQLYTMVSRSRSGSHVHALRADVEEMGVDVQRLEAAKRPETSLQTDVERLRARIAAGPEPYVRREGANRIREAAEERLWRSSEENRLEWDQARLTKLEVQLAEPNSTQRATAPDSIEARSSDLPTEAAARQTELDKLLADVKPAEPAAIPEGAVPWSEVQAGLDQAKAQLEARETVTIQRMAKTAARSQPKQAVNHAEMEAPQAKSTTRRDAEQHYRDGAGSEVSTYRHDMDRDRQRLSAWEREHGQGSQPQGRTSDEIRLQTRERIQAAAQASREQAAARNRNPIPSPMPAATARESMARSWAQTRGTTHEALAMYQSMGQVHYSANPELHAAQLALAHGHQLIVAENSAQAERIQAHLRTAQEARQAKAAEPTSEHAPNAAAAPSLVATAAELYQQRAELRQAWREQTAPEHHHHAEPSAPESGLVVASDYQDRSTLVCGTSAVREAQLVTGEPAELDRLLIDARAQQLSQQQVQETQVQADRQSAQAHQHVQREAAQRTAERGAEHQAEHSAEHAAEPAGAEIG